MVKVNYGINFLDVICMESFNTLTEAKKWIKTQRNKDFELLDIQVFDRSGYWIKDVLLEE